MASKRSSYRLALLITMCLNPNALADSSEEAEDQHHPSQEPKLEIVVPDHLKNKNLRLRLFETNYNLNEDTIKVMRWHSRQRLKVLDRHSRIVAARSSHYNENVLVIMKPARWRIGVFGGQLHPHRGDINKSRFDSSALSAQSIEFGYQPGTLGLALSFSTSKESSKFRNVRNVYKIASAKISALYEHVPFQKVVPVQFGYLLGLGLAEHQNKYHEQEFDIEINEDKLKTSGMHVGYQIRIAPGLGQLWITARYLYGVYTRQPNSSLDHRSKTYIYSMTMLGAQYDF